jgi:hypothetical protein
VLAIVYLDADREFIDKPYRGPGSLALANPSLPVSYHEKTIDCNSNPGLHHLP